MSDPATQEPTMEEILASIRRIISDDDAPAAEQGAPHAAAEPPVAEPMAAAPAPVATAMPNVAAAVPLDVAPAEPAPRHEEEVLELTDRVETRGDLDIYTPEPSTYERRAPQPPVEPAPIESLIGSTTATAAAAAFGMLTSTLHMPQQGRTLEDVTRELLQPLLKDWLDQHLQQIVENTVQSEVDRITRSRIR